MMEEELRRMLKEYGWNLFIRKRYKKEYYYANKWKAGEVYITPVTDLSRLTREEVLRKIS